MQPRGNRRRTKALRQRRSATTRHADLRGWRRYVSSIPRSSKGRNAIGLVTGSESHANVPLSANAIAAAALAKVFTEIRRKRR